MEEIKIRFNTKYLESENQALTWRVLLGNREFLASDVKIFTPSYSTQDLLESGEKKWHLSCKGTLSWEGKTAIIR